jgi:hypothetical protein
MFYFHVMDLGLGTVEIRKTLKFAATSILTVDIQILRLIRTLVSIQVLCVRPVAQRLWCSSKITLIISLRNMWLVKILAKPRSFASLSGVYCVGCSFPRHAAAAQPSGSSQPGREENGRRKQRNGCVHESPDALSRGMSLRFRGQLPIPDFIV